MLVSATGQQTEDFEFTTDWFTDKIPNWDKWLGHFKDQPYIKFLEIGSWEFGSGKTFLERYLTHPTSKLICLDMFPHPARERRFDRNLLLTEQSHRVEKIKGRSEVQLRTLPFDHFQVVYVDGCHEAKHVLTDAILSWYLLCPGGIMIFDDYKMGKTRQETKSPEIGIDAFLDVFDDQYVLLSDLEVDYQVAIRKKAN